MVTRSLNFSICCPSVFPSAPAAPVSTSSMGTVTVETASTWLRDFNAKFPRFERLANNGMTSLLQKEIAPFTECLAQGNAMVHAQATQELRFFVTTLVQPRLQQLGEVLAKAHQRCADDKSVQKDAKRESAWKSFGLPESILEQYKDCVDFLFNSGLIYPIIGYRETSGDLNRHTIRLDHDGHPMILVQGNYKRWERVKNELTYDPNTCQIRSSQYPGSLVQNWTYLYSQGLVPIDRLNNDRLVPIYHLPPDEVARVRAHAQRFYETNREVDPGVAKDWVIQFHTSQRNQCFSLPPFPDKKWSQNLLNNINTHIVMRLVAPNGDVYSFGVEMPAESQQFLSDGLSHFLGTVIAKVNKAGDYEEFRPHDGRMVTSIPLTTQRADNILEYLNSVGDIRFNFLRQNCASLMQIVMKKAGYIVDTQTTITDLIISSAPNLKDIPVVGPTADAVNNYVLAAGDTITKPIPGRVKRAYTWIKNTLLWLPRKVWTVFLNVIVANLGGRKMLHPMPKGMEEDDLYKADRFLNFSRLMRSWTDFFSDRIPEVYHSKGFIEWQKQQRSTFTDTYNGKPKLSIVPPQA